MKDEPDRWRVLMLRSCAVAPNGGATSQPRATPWGEAFKENRGPERAAQTKTGDVTTAQLQTICFALNRASLETQTSSQGVALGWYVRAPSGQVSKQRNIKTGASGRYRFGLPSPADREGPTGVRGKHRMPSTSTRTGTSTTFSQRGSRGCSPFARVYLPFAKSFVTFVIFVTRDVAIRTMLASGAPGGRKIRAAGARDQPRVTKRVRHPQSISSPEAAPWGIDGPRAAVQSAHPAGS